MSTSGLIARSPARSSRRAIHSGVFARGFSGTAVYRHDFTLPEDDLRHGAAATLELGAVRDIARVLLNGIDCGIVWTAPFDVDVSAALRAGTNHLEVHVATPWRNRLIAEAAHASGEIFAPMVEVFEATAVPLPGGLQGSCALRLGG